MGFPRQISSMAIVCIVNLFTVPNGMSQSRQYREQNHAILSWRLAVTSATGYATSRAEPDTHVILTGCKGPVTFFSSCPA
ncbi:hypothetical protein FB567DRAFT_106612 [Paraphoma chrysanthemicola]|uniref:Secreted protein n=1 Tax=Paraphoma chrysanthemicola TaxID=798071 RepID=A0A8K0R3U8_9PLEO|nr:hypothetical protein FB567DRAFT_284604 [Paraphoma chrysanthemicola]KAH7082438.1 hypothetical protein FB567DRAFT_106612 [Paraphoma chrysanthemicola]